MCIERLERDHDDYYSKHGIRLKCIHAVNVEKFLYHNGALTNHLHEIGRFGVH